MNLLNSSVTTILILVASFSLINVLKIFNDDIVIFLFVNLRYNSKGRPVLSLNQGFDTLTFKVLLTI